MSDLVGNPELVFSQRGSYNLDNKILLAVTILSLIAADEGKFVLTYTAQYRLNNRAVSGRLGMEVGWWWVSGEGVEMRG